MAAVWTFDDSYTEELESDDERLVVEAGWLGFLQDNNVLQTATMKQARDAFVAAKGFEIGQAHGDYPGAAFKSLRVSRRENVEAFDFTARWETKDGGESPPDDFEQFMQQSQVNSPDNPHGPEYSGRGQFAEEYSHKDVKGDLFLNAAKQPLTNVPPLLITIQVRRVTLNQRNEPNLSQQGVAEGRDMLQAVEFNQLFHKNKQTGALQKYYRVSYEVWTHPFRDWAKVELLNVGFAFWVLGENGEPKRLEIAKLGNAKDQPLVEQNLTKDGNGILPAGEPPNTITFKFFREGTLNIPYLR